MGANVLVVPTSTVLPTPTPKALTRSFTPTKRAAEPPRGDSSQMDVRSMIVAGVTICGTEDEDLQSGCHSHEDAGELLDPLVD